ncbi:hypothetical protein TIFTF001_049854 [Ficus carica]|uniref:Uncharacterized protein n=1 Tax=Ficus carica TaxID=3494 RepID=A0AA87YTU4_FICCA|nr:hypothetical protein TIFTF001_049854 [Ficus carica]
MEPKAKVSSGPPSLVFPLSDKGGDPLQAENDSESRTSQCTSKPTSKSDRKAKPFLPIQVSEAAPISNHAWTLYARGKRSHFHPAPWAIHQHSFPYGTKTDCKSLAF